MLKIAALDSERKWIEIEKKITENYFHGKDLEFCSYHNEEHFLLDLEKGKIFDIYLLDIAPTQINGLKIAKSIKKVANSSIIIYVTNFIEYAAEAFEVGAYRYILKIMLEEKLIEAYDSLIEETNSIRDIYYVVKTNTCMEKINLKDIYYMKKNGKYVMIFTKNGISKVRCSLRTVYNNLNSNQFVWVDKGCVINLQYAVKLKNRKVKMKNGEELDISQPQLMSVKQRIIERWK